MVENLLPVIPRIKKAEDKSFNEKQKLESKFSPSVSMRLSLMIAMRLICISCIIVSDYRMASVDIEYDQRFLYEK